MEETLYWSCSSFMCAQVSLVAIWVAYGGKWSPWAALVLCITIVCWALIREPSDKEISAVITISLLLQATLIVVPLGVLRALGARFVFTNGPPIEGENISQRTRWQFSLGYLFSWTTAVAIALGLLRYTVQSQYDLILPILRNEWLESSVTILSNVVIAIATLWLILGKRNWMLQLAVLGLTVLALVGFLGLSTSIDDTTFWLILSGGQALWLSISLLVVRVAGFRLLWNRPSLEQTTAAGTV